MKTSKEANAHGQAAPSNDNGSELDRLRALAASLHKRSRRERIATTEILFHETNERIASVFADGAIAEFVCECGNYGCADKIRLGVAELEALHARPGHYALLPGHEIRDVERVVAKRNGYVVVEKFGHVSANGA